MSQVSRTRFCAIRRHSPTASTFFSKHTARCTSATSFVSSDRIDHRDSRSAAASRPIATAIGYVTFPALMSSASSFKPPSKPDTLSASSTIWKARPNTTPKRSIAADTSGGASHSTHAIAHNVPAAPPVLYV
ncbi:hypothetical protein ABL78_8422 [Leptomonas seymouri]|uniref:Uncharacterized protein n=1 Tax=Leptomonas seymouri TaxID=5684 RepID=A0A0N1IG01_LEPSE|nr:hypothetical protein ABL78_8422 [Leptomonas seymouri]|eukprot:KPI82568.1 hypothetical protein ABL78_8422 [Leptomonas seymouri]